MPADHLDDLAAVLAWEQALRLNQRVATPDDPGLTRLHRYWQQIVMLFEAHRQLTHHPRGLLAHRWPRNVPAPPGGRP